MISKVEAKGVKYAYYLYSQRNDRHGVAHFPKVTKECVRSLSYFGPTLCAMYSPR